MSVDPRAYAWCNLGPLADGASSIADSHVQGSGVITTKGTINLAGIVRPAPGAVVELAYSDGQNWIARIPRRLRVLSSFANPLGGKTTSISVGCDLAYYEARKQPPDSLTTRQANPDTPESVWRAAAPAIPASWLVGQILSALGLSVSGSIPLTNQYTRQEFDLTAGYVEELGKLAASEGYAVRMTTAGLVEFVSKDVPLGRSVLITEDDLIDLNPINTGDLAGDSVFAKYSSLKLTAPDNPSDNELQKRNWEREESISAPQQYVHQWTEYRKTPVYDENGNPTYRQRKDANGKPVFYVLGSSIENGIETTILGGAVLDQVFEIKAFQYKQIIGYITKTTTETTYDAWDRVSIRKTSTLGLWGLEYSETVYDYKIPASVAGAIDPKYKPDDYSEVLAERTTEWTPDGPLKTSVGYQQSYYDLRGSGFGSQYQSGYRETKYTRDKSSGITKTVTTSLVPLISTTDGSETISRLRDAGNQVDDSRLSEILATAKRLVSAGSETRIRTEREFGLQRRPSEADRTASANQKAPTVETTAQTTWAVGSAATQTSVELSPPYVSDDRIIRSGSAYTVIKSDADQKALNYSRIENRLLLGHRNGVGLQLLPEMLPPGGIGLVFIRLNGCTAAFLVNGTTFNLDPQGVTATTDALFWGAIDGAVADAWFPLPPGVSLLPAPVAITTNASPQPANAIAIPSGFSFTDPNLASLFASLPTATAPVFPRTAQPGVLIKPYTEAIELAAGGGGGAFVATLPWAPQTVSLIAGGGSGAFANVTPVRLLAGGGAGAFTIASRTSNLVAGGGGGVIANVQQSGGPMLAFSGGTSLAWDNDNVYAYGFSFTLASAKQIKAVGFYDAGGNGLAYSFAVSLVSGWGSSVTTATFPFITTASGYSVIVPSGTAAALDGVWRKVTIGNGATLAAGTYAVVATVNSGSGTFDAMIKNASTVTPLPGVTINGPFGYDFNDDVISTSGDTNGYFGPVLFF